MAPKSSGGTSLGSSQPQPFQAAVTKLSERINQIKKKTGEIKAQSIVDKLQESLRDYRTAGKILEPPIIGSIVESLESDGDNTCSRLDPTVFCTIVELVLQTDACLHGERVLFLLAKSLFEDAQHAENGFMLKNRKSKIGESCRERLLGYFIDKGTAPTMRRWAGVLCVQLFSDCEQNRQWLELGPDHLRRNIGQAVLGEHDEILRIIYAQLLRTLLNADMELGDLFPADCKEEVYADFPPSTQDKTGWGGSFQNYVDILFTKGLIEAPTLGTLWFATTVSMRPEDPFGVQGHTKYIFLHETDDSIYEMSMLAPAQSGTFDRILDIPVRSIKSLSIITNEYSQVAGAIGLELSSGPGLEFFLDSQKVELDSLYLTFQPHHIEDFKNELIGICPGLKVAQANKETAINPTSSDEQKSRSQVSISDDFMAEATDRKQELMRPSSTVSQAPRLRKNSIYETQEDQDGTQNSVHATAPDARNNDDGDDGETPQAKKALSNIVSTSKESASKSTAPSKLFSGIKPKAKPPIVQRGLKAKPSQASTEELAAASAGRTCAKPKQTELITTAREKSTSQGTEGKQKQSELAANAQHDSASQSKEDTVNTQPKMPLPKSKPNSKTRSTRSSQVTGNIENSQTTEKIKAPSRGTRKAAVNSTKQSASSSKNLSTQSLNVYKSRFSGKEPTELSQAGKDCEHQQFSDDFSTDVDDQDASTPKVTGASQACKKTPATSTSNTQANKLRVTAGPTSQKQKRYSLHAPVKTAPVASNLYNIPVDDDKEAEAPKKTKGKKSIKAVKSAPKAAPSAKTTSKTSIKADTKKRQSAPAALGIPVGTRHSQRAAAAKASEQLRGADKSDLEDAEDDDQQGPAKSAESQRDKTAAATKAKDRVQAPDKSDDEDTKVGDRPAPVKYLATQTGKKNTAQCAENTNAASKKVINKEVAQATERDEKMAPLPEPDEAAQSPVGNDAIDRVDVDNIYDTTPKKPSQKPQPRKLQDPVVEDSQKLVKISKVPNKKKKESTLEKESAPEESGEIVKASGASRKDTRTSTLEMASRLGEILRDVSDDPPETEPSNSVVRKESVQSTELMKPKPTKAVNEEVPTRTKATTTAGNESVVGNTKSKSTLVWKVLDSSFLPTEEHMQASVFPSAPKEIAKSASKQEKSTAIDDKSFKKPEIPAHHKKTTVRPDEWVPSTVESSLSDVVLDEEPEPNVATSPMTNKAIAETEQDTPIDHAHDEPGTGDAGRKRKVELTVTTPRKRQRINESQNRAMGSSPDALLPSSLSVRAPPSPKQPKKLRRSIENVTSPRRRPRMVDRAIQTTEALQQATSDATSAAKDPNRKPHLVSFGTKGALNQGISGTIKTCKDPPSPKNIPEEVAKPARKHHPSTMIVLEESPKPVCEDIGEKKRKREKLDVVDAESLPNKRQSASPRETTAANEYEYEYDDLPAFQDSPPAEAIKTQFTRDRRNARSTTRPSSQISKVDKNGSPMGSSQEDHMGKLRERLAKDRTANKPKVPPSALAESPVTVRPRTLSEVFGPRVVLEKKLKARKSSPEETAARYVAHEKTANGVYQEVATKQVIAPQKKVHDPFIEKGRKSSGFTDLLMSGSSTGKHSGLPKPSEVITTEQRKGQDIEPDFSLHTRVAPKANHCPEPAWPIKQVDDRERTRVEIGHQASDPSLPSEMTRGSSYDSQSSQAERVPLSNRPTASAVWNVAIRPHYTDLHAAVHRIADEVILRLQDQEDMMGMLVEQYKEEGGKVLDKLEQRHENERVTVVGALNQKRAEMVSIYSEAKELILDTAKDLKENSIAQFEREWRKRQEVIRDDIAEGRKVSRL